MSETNETNENIISQMRQLNQELKARYGSKGICTIGVTPSTKNPSSFVLVMPQHGERKQSRVPLVKKGHNASFSLGGLNVAYGLASEVCTKLRDGSFVWNWLDSFLDKNQQQEAQKTVSQWTEEYVQAWWRKPVKKDGKQVKKAKKDQRYINAVDFLREVFSSLPQNQPFTMAAIEAALKQFPDNQIGQKKVEALSRLLEFAGIYEYKALTDRKREQAIAGIEERPKYVPTDQEIVETCNNGYCTIRRDGRKKGGSHLEAALRQRWLFGLLATYGIRVHEAWMVMNWTNPVEVKAGEFIEIDEDAGQQEYAIGTIQAKQGKVIPAFFDIDNEQPLLVIKGGKTGKRIAMPLSPKGESWIDAFGLKNHDKAHLPEYKEPLKLLSLDGGSSVHECTQQVCDYFRVRVRWDLLPFPRFTAHKLRHAYTHRGRLIGINHQTLALSQGHLPSTADMVYARHFAEERTLEAIQAAQEQLTNSQNTSLPPMESAIAHATAIAGDNADKLDAATRLLSFIYGTPVTLP